MTEDDDQSKVWFSSPVRVGKHLDESPREKMFDYIAIDLLENRDDMAPEERMSDYRRRSEAVRTDQLAVPEVIFQGDSVETEEVQGVPVSKMVQGNSEKIIGDLARAINSVHQNNTALMDPHFGNFLIDSKEVNYGGNRSIYFIDPEFSVPEASQEMIEYDLKDVVSRIALTFRDDPIEKLQYFDREYGSGLDIPEILREVSRDYRILMDPDYRKEIQGIADRYEK